MAVRSRKSSRTISARIQFTSSPPNAQIRHRSAARSTPHQLSNGDQDPESPIGTFAATSRPARLAGKENRSPKTSSRTVVAAAKKHRSHLQRVQLQSRPADPLPPPSNKPSDGSSGDTVDISLFPTARTNALGTTRQTPTIAPRVLVDQTVDLNSEPGLLEILSQSARSRSQSIAHNKAKESLSIESRIKLEIDYPPSCFTATQAQILARRLGSSLIRTDSARPSNWAVVSRDTIRNRCAAAAQAAKTLQTSQPRRQLFQYASDPPSSRSVCGDIGLTHPYVTAPQVPEFSHRSPAIGQHDELPQKFFVHRPKYSGYSHNLYTPPRFEVKHTWAADPAAIANGPRQVVKIIIPFHGTPFLSIDSVTSADFVHLTPAEDHDAQECSTESEPARLVWMHSTAQSFILALEQLLQSFEEKAQFGPILYYTTSSPPSASSECAYVTLYVHSDLICQARALLATIDVAAPGNRSHRSVLPFASRHISLLVLSCSGHPICLI